MATNPESPEDEQPRPAPPATHEQAALLRTQGRRELVVAQELAALKERTRAAGLSSKERECLKNAHKALIQAPAGWRRQVRVCQQFVPRLARLRAQFPHFAQVIAAIEGTVHLACYGNRVVAMPPMLLVGPAGVGKTYFAARLAATLRLPYEEIHMENTSAGWILAGSDATWAEGRPGRIYDVMAHGHYANPLVLLDEIDKVSMDARYNPMGPIYGLLEGHTAARFRDEYMRVAMDVSGINWMLTANALDTVPLPIRSRTRIYTIPEPNFRQRRAIVGQMYHLLRAKHDWGRRFDPVLDDDVADFLAEAPGSTRDVRATLMRAFERASVRGGQALQRGDVVEPDDRVWASGIDLRSVAVLGHA